jgi:catechol 2,3-dioxygenase-like lactoylglutathione lyase family enzyme
MKKRRMLVLAILAVNFAPALTNAQTVSVDTGITRLRYVTILVKDYEEALAWYTHTLGLKKIEDRSFGAGRRWIVVAPEGQAQLGIVLDVPQSDTSAADRTGKETDWVFEVADCSQFYETLRKRGVHFIAPPKKQVWGTMQVIFEDPYGNRFVAESQAPNTASDHPNDR